MSNDIGKKLATQLGTTVTPEQHDKLRKQEAADKNLRFWETLKRTLNENANSFNGAKPDAPRLTIVDGGSRIMFNYIGNLTLSVIFSKETLQLAPRQKSVNNVAQTIIVVDNEPPYSFRFINPNPTVQTPEFSLEKLVERILRMALDQPASV